MRHLIKFRTLLKIGDFYGKKIVQRFIGTLKHIFRNLEQQYSARQMFQPPTHNYFSAFRAQGNFNLFKKTIPWPVKILSL